MSWAADRPDFGNPVLELQLVTHAEMLVPLTGKFLFLFGEIGFGFGSGGGGAGRLVGLIVASGHDESAGGARRAGVSRAGGSSGRVDGELGVR